MCCIYNSDYFLLFICKNFFYLVCFNTAQGSYWLLSLAVYSIAVLVFKIRKWTNGQILKRNVWAFTNVIGHLLLIFMILVYKILIKGHLKTACNLTSLNYYHKN